MGTLRNIDESLKNLIYLDLLVKNLKIELEDAMESNNHELIKKITDILNEKELDLKIFKSAINSLSKDDQLLIELRYVQRKNWLKVADQLQISKDGCYKRRNNIVKKLNLLLSSLYENK